MREAERSEFTDERMTIAALLDRWLVSRARRFAGALSMGTSSTPQLVYCGRRMGIHEGCACAFDLFEDIGGFLCPDERLGVAIVIGDVVADCANQLIHAAKDAAA